MLLATFRFLLAAVFMYGWCRCEGTSIRIRRGQWRPVAVMSLYMFFQIIGLLGTVCGQNGVNIANFALGRNRPGGDAIALLYLDAPFPEQVLAKVRAHETIDSAKPLRFDVSMM